MKSNPTKKKERVVKAWCVVDVENKGLDTKEVRIFYGTEGDYHIFKTRKEALEWRNKQFFPAEKMGWRAYPCTIHITSKDV